MSNINKEKDLAKEDTEEILLSKSEVFDVIEFARYASGLGEMPMSIDLLNRRLKDISLLDTGEVTSTQVDDALKAPKDNERELQRQSQHFEIISQIYKRLLNYMGNVPSFDFTYTCINIDEVERLKTGEDLYNKDLDIVREFFDRFNHKEEFAKISRQLLRQEAYFSVFRDDGSKYVFQELPSERSKITGKFPYGLLFSFDYNYFLEGGTNLDFYPPVFKRTLAKLGKSKAGEYVPSQTIGLRGRKMFAQWVDCSPTDNFWMFKLSPEIATRIPFFAGIFPDLVQEPVIRALQKSSYMASAAKIIHGEVPFLKKGKADQKNSVAITPKMLGNFMSLVRSALDSDAVKFTSSPLQNVEGFEFEADNDIRSSALRTTIGASGVSANLLFADDVKPNTMETQLSLAVDEIMMTQIYGQMEAFLNFYINRMTNRFKFKFELEGTNFYTDRKRRSEAAYGMAERGIVLPQKIAAAQGISPFDLDRQMKEAKLNGFVDRLTPITVASQTPNAGRPSVDEDSLTDSGIQTRDGGYNEGKGE